MAANEPGQPALTSPAAGTGIVSIDLPVPSVALAVGAHPDDVEFGAGGTLATPYRQAPAQSKASATSCMLALPKQRRGGFQKGRAIGDLLRSPERQAVRRVQAHGHALDAPVGDLFHGRRARRAALV